LNHFYERIDTEKSLRKKTENQLEKEIKDLEILTLQHENKCMASEDLLLFSDFQ
jgi:hypothetical protein